MFAHNYFVSGYYTGSYFPPTDLSGGVQDGGGRLYEDDDDVLVLVAMMRLGMR